jgi:hypothetical protein
MSIFHNKTKLLNSLKYGLSIGSILFLAGCIEKEKIATIPDAENILFTSTGQLLVTGGESIYQVKKHIDTDGHISYETIDLIPENFFEKDIFKKRTCGFTGIAQHNDWVFTTCQQLKLAWKGWTFKLWQDSHLLAANISDGKLEFKIINDDPENDPLDDLGLPNGLAFSPDGKLIVADTDYLSSSGVARITLDYSNEYPRIQSLEENWINLEYGLQNPNGVRVEGNHLYVSDNNKVRRFTFDQNGEIPLLFNDESGNEIKNTADQTVFYRGLLLIDDFMPYCGGIAVTHFGEGQLVYQTATKEKYSTLPFSFEFPSSLAFGKGSNFSGNELFVTEKGVLREMNSSIGNQLSKVNMDFDLGNPNTCAAINELN